MPVDAAPVCTPGTATCADDMLRTCNEAGQYGAPVACPLGCHTSGERCWQLDPSNGVAAQLDDARNQPALELTDGATINTDSGEVRNGNGNVVTVASVVVSNRRVFVAKSAVLNDVTVRGGNGLTIVSDGEIVVKGTVSVAARGHQSGAGGSRNGDGVDGYPIGDLHHFRGGGGACGKGGTGGRAGNNAMSEGGRGCSMVTVGFSGGRGGRAGTSNSVAEGGGGGGFLQLTSAASIVIHADAVGTGLLNANGGGGEANGGGGGGGGLIIVEAPSLKFEGTGSGIVANGGGGGGACSAAGADGALSTTPARGGQCTGAFTNGGNGATGRIAATNGADYSGTAATSGTGGGGGGPGLIQVFTRDGNYTSGSATVLSGVLAAGLAARR